MPGRKGIIHGTLALARRVGAHRNGRLFAVGLLLIVVPFCARAALFAAILALPQPTKSNVYGVVWRNSRFHEYPAVAAMICGAALITFVCVRLAVNRLWRS